MQLLKKSVAILTLSALVISLLPMQSYAFNNPFDPSEFKLNNHKIGIFAAFITLPFILLHTEKNLPNCIRNNPIFKIVIGKPEYKGQKTYPEKPGSEIMISRETTTQKAEGICGHIDKYIKKVLKGFASYEGLDKIIIITLLGINALSHKSGSTPPPSTN